MIKMIKPSEFFIAYCMIICTSFFTIVHLVLQWINKMTLINLLRQSPLLKIQSLNLLSEFITVKDFDCSLILISYLTITYLYLNNDMSSNVILSMFLVILSRFYIQNREVLMQLLMISEYLKCFLYLIM